MTSNVEDAIKPDLNTWQNYTSNTAPIMNDSTHSYVLLLLSLRLPSDNVQRVRRKEWRRNRKWRNIIIWRPKRSLHFRPDSYDVQVFAEKFSSLYMRLPSLLISHSLVPQNSNPWSRDRIPIKTVRTVVCAWDVCFVSLRSLGIYGCCIQWRH